MSSIPMAPIDTTNDKPGALVETAPASPLTPPEPAHLDLPKPSLDATTIPLSQCTTPAADTDNPNGTSSPFSPFYSHPTTRTSFEQLKCSSATHLQVYETSGDLESGNKRFSSEHNKSMASSTQTKDCKVWPKKSTIMKERAKWKRTQGCYPWNVMTKRQRLYAHLFFILLGIGLVVGVCVGISRAVGGTVYAGERERNHIE